MYVSVLNLNKDITYKDKNYGSFKCMKKMLVDITYTLFIHFDKFICLQLRKNRVSVVSTLTFKGEKPSILYIKGGIYI